MSDVVFLPVTDGAADGAVTAPARRRPKPGERRVQILQALATMLEQPGAERITTAALAARLQVSEAALYRHFASKAQMFEGLIEFVEQSIFALVNQITADPADPEDPTRLAGLVEPAGLANLADTADAPPDPRAGDRQAQHILTVLLQFGEKNPGLTRVMVGDALVFENERLQLRMNQFFDKIEASLRQCLRSAARDDGAATPTVDAAVRASLMTTFVIGRLQRFARSGFRRAPTEHLQASLDLLTRHAAVPPA